MVNKKKPKKGQKGYRAPPGLVAKANGWLRGLKIGLPAIRSFTAGLPIGDAVTDAGTRYSGFDFTNMTFDQGKATVTAGFYSGNFVERKVLSVLRIPQMAGQKKLLSVVAQYLPEIQAAGELMQGADARTTGDLYGMRSIGYKMNDHQSWFESPGVRAHFTQTLFARAILGLVSRFAGPFVNPHLPNGVGI